MILWFTFYSAAIENEHVATSGIATHASDSGTAPHGNSSGTAPHGSGSGTAPHGSGSGTAPRSGALDCAAALISLQAAGCCPLQRCLPADEGARVMVATQPRRVGARFIRPRLLLTGLFANVAGSVVVT
ncbi:hypothetical protein KIN20_034102 [Parelaphostrongylus tenuis]|uniref:Uncharacterized protein n=1 Tax=Parelaphostrongylus tenuis TaxID=148309 RepID=A0AAD5RBS0_PARTN|nr:hypothetical protein KIN20_034102 [Parelaphostrongylus tenuis]